MSRPTQARWLAPLALVGALIALIVTIASSGGKSSSGGAPAPASTSTRPARTPTFTTATTASPTAATQRTYTVQPGDVLSSIAERTGVSLDQLEQLNPGVDAQSLHAGQKLKLAP
jgi:teichoic acid transport system ATP-binding protein